MRPAVTAPPRSHMRRFGLAIGLSLAVSALAFAADSQAPAPIPIALPGGEGGVGLDDLGYSATLNRVLVPGGRTGKLFLVDPSNNAVSAISGFGTEVPLFLPMGRSYDATVAPGFFTGSGGHTTGAPGSRGVVGPRLGLQFRYAPIERTGGQIDVDLVRDLKAKNSPGGPNPRLDYTAGGVMVPGELPSAPGRGYDDFRGVLRFSHRTEAPGTLVAAQGSLATDSMYLQDTEVRELDRFLDALRTDAGAVRTQGPAAAGIDATLLFDVRTGNNNQESPDRRLFGAER